VGVGIGERDVDAIDRDRFLHLAPLLDLVDRPGLGIHSSIRFVGKNTNRVQVCG
jgi:hypothetical protein